MDKINGLVVEDEQIVAKDIQQSLEKLGYSVTGTCAEGQEAIRIAEKTIPDIVLMDIMLKGDMTGIEAAAHIRKSFNIPVIYLTAYADKDTLQRAKITEPHGYILKPFREIDLQTSIEMSVYKHRKESDIKKERDYYFSIIENKSSDDSIFVKAA